MATIELGIRRQYLKEKAGRTKCLMILANDLGPIWILEIQLPFTQVTCITSSIPFAVLFGKVWSLVLPTVCFVGWP